MIPRSALLALLALPLVAAGCSESRDPLHGAARGKDVLVIVIDTLRADALPMYGYPVDTAPTLARLAKEGALFEHAWANSSWTAPSAASLFTALHPDQHGVLSGYHAYKHAQGEDSQLRLNRIPRAAETLPVLFQRLGYQTFGVADNPNICERLGFTRGFDDFQVESYAGAERVNELARLWAAKRRGEGPAFMYVHYMDPHAPYNQREPWYHPPVEADEIALDRAAYDSEIRYLDGHIAELLEILDVGPDTLVVLVSDHGEEFGEHGGRYHDFQLYSELTHVPMLIHGPALGIEPRRVQGPVSLIDVLPTLRDLLGAPASEQDQGRSLLPQLGGGTDVDRAVYTMRTKEGPGEPRHKHAVVQGGWKYILSRPEGTEELYDLEKDPREKSDLAAREVEHVKAMRGLLDQLEELPRLPRSFSEPSEMTPEQRAELDRLGYGGGGEAEK